MSHKEKYRAERREEILRTERRVRKLCRILSAVIVATMFLGLAALSALDGNHTEASLLVAVLSFTIMTVCLIMGEKLEDEYMPEI